MNFTLRPLGRTLALGTVALLAVSLCVAQSTGNAAATPPSAGSAPAASPTAPAQPPAAKPAAASPFPAGPGRNTFLRVCSQCHSPDQVMANRQDSSGWAATLNQMIQNGAQGSNSDFDAIYQYLTTYFNLTPAPGTTAPTPSTPPASGSSGTAAPSTPSSGAQGGSPQASLSPGAEAAEPDFPAGAGKMTFLTTCSQCHTPERVIGRARTASGWKRTVAAMRRHGAKGTSAQFAEIAAYLAKVVGPAPAKVDVNTATVLQLRNWLRLPKPQAEAIVQFRKQHGAFGSLEQVERVPGVTASLVEGSERQLTL